MAPAAMLKGWEQTPIVAEIGSDTEEKNRIVPGTSGQSVRRERYV